MADFCVDMLREVFVIVVIVSMIASEVVVPVSYATVVRSDAMIEVLTGTVTSVRSAFVNVFAGMYANMWAATLTALGSMPMPTRLEEVLTFGWGACSC